MARQPDDALLALLLGNAIGVMLLLSVYEMWLHNAAEHGWAEISLAFALGALLYQVVQPFIPEFGTHHLAEPGHQHHSELEKVGAGGGCSRGCVGSWGHMRWRGLRRLLSAVPHC